MLRDAACSPVLPQELMTTTGRRLRAWIAFSAGWVLAPSLATAQISLDPDYSFIHQTTLSNGLDVVVVESSALPLVTIELAVRNGAFTEPPELNGLSHLYEHMFFKGNAAIPDQAAYLARQRELGMVWNGTTGAERVNYFFTLHREDLEGGLQFMSDAIRTPLFREDELVREREVVLGEFDRNEASPGYHLAHAMDGLLWFEHPSRKDPLGDRPTISSATVDQMRWMQDTYYIPNNSLLILAGDLTRDEGFALAETIFGDWEAGPDPFEAYPIPEHPPLTGHTAALVELPLQISAIQIGWHGPDTRGDVDGTYAADVLSYILGQEESPFQQRLVDTGLALQASLAYYTLRYTGPITLTLVTQPGNEESAIRQALTELRAMRRDGYFTPEQMATAATLLAVSDLRSWQRTDELAHTLSHWWASADLDYYLGYIRALSRVQTEDIYRFLDTYLLGQPMAVVVMGNPAALAAGGLTEQRLLEIVAEEVNR